MVSKKAKKHFRIHLLSSMYLFSYIPMSAKGDIVSAMSIMQCCIFPQDITYMLIFVMILSAPHFLSTYQLYFEHYKGRFTRSMPCPCRTHSIPLPYLPAKGLECVFPIWITQCGRVWSTLTMPDPCHPRPCRSSQGHGTACPSRDGLWDTCLRSASSGYHAELHEVIRRTPISDAGD